MFINKLLFTFCIVFSAQLFTSILAQPICKEIRFEEGYGLGYNRIEYASSQQYSERYGKFYAYTPSAFIWGKWGKNVADTTFDARAHWENVKFSCESNVGIDKDKEDSSFFVIHILSGHFGLNEGEILLVKIDPKIQFPLLGRVKYREPLGAIEKVERHQQDGIMYLFVTTLNDEDTLDNEWAKTRPFCEIRKELHIYAIDEKFNIHKSPSIILSKTPFYSMGCINPNTGHGLKSYYFLNMSNPLELNVFYVDTERLENNSYEVKYVFNKKDKIFIEYTD
ncbi:MAG: hypothetical protein JNN12_12305 [Bacteroidetes Order II. Incertae sedis bacterium]|nr:hypothetical protein [Bacteroidetes Order II. bacterium]